MWKFPGQGSNPHGSSDPSHWSDNMGSLTCWATQELPKWKQMKSSVLSNLNFFQVGNCFSLLYHNHLFHCKLVCCKKKKKKKKKIFQGIRKNAYNFLSILLIRDSQWAYHWMFFQIFFLWYMICKDKCRIEYCFKNVWCSAAPQINTIRITVDWGPGISVFF